MRTTLRSLWTWIGIATIVTVAVPAMALVRLFDRDPAHYRTGRLFRWFGGLVTHLNPAWHLSISGDLPDDPRRPFVVVGNHQSFGDIPAVSRLPWEMKWVVKAELLRVPLFGWLLRMAGDIPVDRRSKRSRAAVLPKARAYLQKRCSVMFFPEGTRSRDGRVLRFAEGPFRLAIRAGVPVLPLAIDGTRGTLPKGGWRFDTDCRIRLKVLAPVSTGGLGAEDADDLREEVRRRIIEQVAGWRGIPAHAADARASDPSASDPSSGNEGDAEAPGERTAAGSEEPVNTANTARSAEKPPAGPETARQP